MKIDVSIGRDEIYERLAKADEAASKINPPVAVGEVSGNEIPSVVYHPSRHEDVHTYQPNALKGTDNYTVHQQIDRPALSRPIRSMDEIANDHVIAWGSLDFLYKQFLKDLVISNPMLVGKEIGFTVANDGSLVLKGVQGLTEAEATFIENKLNRSDSLVRTASHVAKLTIEMVESSTFNAKGHRFNLIHLDMENFSQTMDLGRALGYGVKGGAERMNSLWYNQVLQGEARYGGWKQLR